jgi:RNA polymerase sigma-70 factor (ECF subfamily)
MRDLDIMMSSGDDYALLRQIATGDEGALEQLFVKYRPPLRRFLWYQLNHDLAQVEDVVQETFVSVWRAAHTVHASSSVMAWIFQIAHRHALNVHRRARSRVESHVAPMDLDDERDVLTESPEDDILTRLDLSAAIQNLSDKHREVLYLICLHGFSADEAAEILAVPAGTVRSRLRHARQALHQILERMRVAEDV